MLGYTIYPQQDGPQEPWLLGIMKSSALVADMEKDNFFIQARFDPKLFYPKKCVILRKVTLQT